MPKRKIDIAPNRSYKEIWWSGSTEYTLNAETGVIRASGQNQHRFRLDIPDLHDALLNDVSKLASSEDVKTWVDNWGLITRGATTKVEHVLQRAASLRWLLELNEAVKESVQGDRGLKHFGQVQIRPHLEFDTTANRVVRASDQTVVSIRFQPPIEEMRPGQKYQYFKGIFGILDEPRDPQPEYTYLERDFKSQPDVVWQWAARQYMKDAVEPMLQDPTTPLFFGLEWFQNDDQTWGLRPVHLVKTPWQAIGLALMKRVCSKRFEADSCPRCNAPIVGRKGKESCGNETCRKWCFRNRVAAGRKS